MNGKPGDAIRLILRDGEPLEGILMPDEGDFCTIKLPNGYNIGVAKSRIKQVQVTDAHKEKKAAPQKSAPKAGLPKISILHTGGTIASKVDYKTGGVIARFSPEELQSMFPELRGIANISSRLVSNMFSEDMRFGHYNILIKEIEKEIKSGADGIIVTHGTDTLHYSAAALSFALENLPIPVILVGSQRSSDRGSTDAALNVLSAALFCAAHKNFADVGVCMHETTEDTTCVILPGVKCRKMHSSRRDAFKAVNAGAWARVDFAARKVDLLRTDYRRPDPKKKLTTSRFDEDCKVAMLKTHPNMYAKEILSYKGWDGLIIEGTGLGNMPVDEVDAVTKENAKILAAIKTIAKDTVVVMTTQTIFGPVNMNVYSSGRKQMDAGIIGNLTDTPPETAFIKLAWLLSNNPKKEVRSLYAKNYRGEISERLENNA